MEVLIDVVINFILIMISYGLLAFLTKTISEQCFNKRLKFAVAHRVAIVLAFVISIIILIWQKPYPNNSCRVSMPTIRTSYEVTTNSVVKGTTDNERSQIAKEAANKGSINALNEAKAIFNNK